MSETAENRAVTETVLKTKEKETSILTFFFTLTTTTILLLFLSLKGILRK